MRRLLAVLALVSFTACGKLGSDFGPQIDGSWSGSANGQLISMQLIQTGNVTGVATLALGGGSSRTYAVSGTFANPTLKVTLSTSQPAETIEMETVVTGRTMIGNVTGGGFAGEAIAMSRQ